MDTTHLEYTAEDLIAHILQRNGFLVAKPKFDREGTDLIALLSVDDGAKFCRIQCKGRSLTKSKNSNIKIPVDYVSGAFFVFLYVDLGEKDTHIFCFSVDDIKKSWKHITKDKTNYYCLYLYRKTILDISNKSNLLSFLFDSAKIELIKKIIKRSISEEEIKLFKLVKMQIRLYKKSKEYNELKELISELKHMKDLEKLHKENLESLIRQYENELPELQKELPEELIIKINELLAKKTPIKKIINELKGKIPLNIPIPILEEFISKVLIQKGKI